MDAQYSYMHRPVTGHIFRGRFEYLRLKIVSTGLFFFFLMLKFVFWRKKTASFGVFLFFNKENKFLKVMTVKINYDLR